VKLLNTALLGATFLIGAAAAASAADVYDRKGSFKDAPESYAPPITWTGFYVGVHAGATFDDHVDTSNDRLENPNIDSAFLGGVHVGYNWQRSPNWVLGIEGSVDFVDDELHGDGLTDYLASIRGRIGYAFGEHLLYGTGGVAFLSYDSDRSIDDAVGFVVGAGLERKLTNNISVGVEGLYYDFSSESNVQDTDVDRDFWTVQARLSYHFNRGYEEALK
jgi:outer membrane immunogenic protein